MSTSERLAGYAGYRVFAPSRLLFRGMVRATSTPLDPEVGNVAEVTVEDLAGTYKGKRAMLVGGSRGIGAAIKETLVRAGAHVTIVARSAAGENGIAAHLDTVAGCRKFIAEASAAGVAPYDYLVFTVGAWPDFSDPFTADGVDKVVALDLLARHLVLEGLAKAGLLNQGGRVLNVLASAQNVPRLTEEGLKARVTCSDGPPRTLPYSLLPLSVAADAWLQDAAARHPSLTFIGTFPGILPTELPNNTFPAWMLPLLTMAMLPVASSHEDVGLAHAAVLASANAGRRRASYFNAATLEGRLAHPLAYKTDVGRWITAHMDEVSAKAEGKAVS